MQFSFQCDANNGFSVAIFAGLDGRERYKNANKCSGLNEAEAPDRAKCHCGILGDRGKVGVERKRERGRIKSETRNERSAQYRRAPLFYDNEPTRRSLTSV